MNQKNTFILHSVLKPQGKVTPNKLTKVGETKGKQVKNKGFGAKIKVLFLPL